MKFIKNILAMLFVITMLSSSLVSYGETLKVSDISQHWAGQTIKKWIEDERVKGFPDGTFRPDKAMNFAEIMTLINRIYGYDSSNNSNYIDVVESDWFYKQTAIGKNSKYMDWYKSEYLNPMKSVNRQEFCAIVSKALILQASEGFEGIDKFNDKNAIATWCKEYIDSVVSKGYMEGYPNGKIEPTNPITRAEVVVLLDRILGTYIYDINQLGSKKTYEGNVTIKCNNVSLKNITINGDLILAPGIDSKDIILNNVTVKGDLVVINEKGAKITIDKSNINRLVLGSKSEVDLKKGTTIDKLLATDDSTKTVIKSELGSKIKNLIANAEIEIKGKAKIELAEINANDVKIEPAVNKKKVAKGIKANNVKQKPRPTPTSSAGSSGGGTPTPPPVVKSSAKDIKSTTIGTLDNSLIKDIPRDTKVNDLFTGIVVSNKATAAVLDSTGGAEVADPANTVVSDTMVIKVTAEDGSSREYTIVLVPLNDGKSIIKTQYGVIDDLIIKDVCELTIVKGFMDGLTVSDKATASIIMKNQPVGTIKYADPKTEVTNDMQIIVSAEDSSQNIYDIETRPAYTGNKIVSIPNTIAQIVGSEGNQELKYVPKDTTVGGLLNVMSVSKGAKKYVLASDIVIKDEDTILTDDHIVEIVSESGVGRRYPIEIKKEYIEINSIEDLRSIEGGVNSKGTTYKLMKNIDFSDDASYDDTTNKTKEDIVNWKPIADFQGIFDGNGMKIKNLKCNATDQGIDVAGLFGTIYHSATIKNLSLLGVDIVGDSNKAEAAVGALVGKINGADGDRISITNCHSTGKVSAGTKGIYAGGLIGKVVISKNKDAENWDEKIISSCSSSANVNGDRFIGGLVGAIYGATQDKVLLYKSSADGNVYARGNHAGGLVGLNNRSHIRLCYTEGRVSTDSMYAGSLLGGSECGDTSLCYATGDITGATDSEEIGGLIGRITNSNVRGCYSRGKVQNGAEKIGGLIGEVEDSIIKDCYSTGDVNADANMVGGMAGRITTTTIENCYSSSMVIGKSAEDSNKYSVGGIVGEVNTGSGSVVKFCAAMNDRLNGSHGRVVGAGDDWKGRFDYGTSTNSVGNICNRDILITNGDMTSADKKFNGYDGSYRPGEGQFPIKYWAFAGAEYSWKFPIGFDMNKSDRALIYYSDDETGERKRLGSDNGDLEYRFIHIETSYEPADALGKVFRIKGYLNRASFLTDGVQKAGVHIFSQETGAEVNFETAEIITGVKDEQGLGYKYYFEIKIDLSKSPDIQKNKEYGLQIEDNAYYLYNNEEIKVKALQEAWNFDTNDITD